MTPLAAAAARTYPYPELLSPATRLNGSGDTRSSVRARRLHVDWSRGPDRDPLDLLGAVPAAGQHVHGHALGHDLAPRRPLGTNETWHFSDGATAPLMAGLEVQVDDEIVRILSGSGTAWVVYRG